MKQEEKVLLLAEMFGVDVNVYIQQILEQIEDSEHYKKLKINMEMAKKYQVPYTEKILKQYEELEIDHISSIKDAYISRAKVDYLYEVSQPKYFINPIMFNQLEMDTNISTIGELPCYYQGKEMTINDLIVSNTIPIDEKLNTIKNQTNKWTNDINETIILPITNILSERKGPKNMFDNFIWYIRRGLIFPIFTIFGFILFFISVFSSRQFFVAIIYDQKIASYVFLCFTIFLFLLLAVELVDFRVQKRFSNEKHSALSYLKGHSSLAVKYFEDAIFKIRKSLLYAIKENQEDKTSISKVNNLANFRKILLILNSKDDFEDKYSDKFIEIINIMRITMLVLFIIAFIFYIIMLIISYLQGAIV